MKNVIMIFSLGIFIIASSFSVSSPEPDCFYKDFKLKQDTKGRCYYINAKGKRTYIDKEYCNSCGKLA